MTNSIDWNQWLNVTSESRDRIQLFFSNYALGRNRTRDPRVSEPKQLFERQNENGEMNSQKNQ
jgi:hypothetical protein